MTQQIRELPLGLRLFRILALFTTAIFGLASAFLLLVVFFAPGPVQVNGRAVELEEFRGIGLAMAAGAATLSAFLGLSLVLLARRDGWFRTVVVLLAAAILGGGVVANLIADRADLAVASGVLTIAALAILWRFFFRSPSVVDYLDGA